MGKTLYQNYLEHLRGHQRSDFFLYTDPLCTVEFYEARGLRRAADEPMILNFHDGTGDIPIGVYLYAGRA